LASQLPIPTTMPPSRTAPPAYRSVSTNQRPTCHRSKLRTVFEQSQPSRSEVAVGKCLEKVHLAYGRTRNRHRQILLRRLASSVPAGACAWSWAHDSYAVAPVPPLPARFKTYSWKVWWSRFFTTVTLSAFVKFERKKRLANTETTNGHFSAIFFGTEVNLWKWGLTLQNS